MKICIGNVCEKKSACSDVNSVKEKAKKKYWSDQMLKNFLLTCDRKMC